MYKLLVAVWPQQWVSLSGAHCNWLTSCTVQVSPPIKHLPTSLTYAHMDPDVYHGPLHIWTQMCTMVHYTYGPRCVDRDVPWSITHNITSTNDRNMNI